MNIKNRMRSALLLAGTLGAISPLQAGFVEELQAVRAGTQPFIAKIVRLQDEQSLIHLVGTAFGEDAHKDAEATVRINGKAVASRRINGHRITLALPEGLTPDAHVTVTVHGKESMREVLGTPALLAHPKAMLGDDHKSEKRHFCMAGRTSYSTQANGDSQATQVWVGFTYQDFNAMVRAAFPDQITGCIVQ